MWKLKQAALKESSKTGCTNIENIQSWLGAHGKRRMLGQWLTKRRSNYWRNSIYISQARQCDTFASQRNLQLWRTGCTALWISRLNSCIDAFIWSVKRCCMSREMTSADAMGKKGPGSVDNTSLMKFKDSETVVAGGNSSSNLLYLLLFAVLVSWCPSFYRRTFIPNFYLYPIFFLLPYSCWYLKYSM